VLVIRIASKRPAVTFETLNVIGLLAAFASPIISDAISKVPFEPSSLITNVALPEANETGAYLIASPNTVNLLKGAFVPIPTFVPSSNIKLFPIVLVPVNLGR
jgi:hypothetical protein